MEIDFNQIWSIFRFISWIDWHCTEYWNLRIVMLFTLQIAFIHLNWVQFTIESNPVGGISIFITSIDWNAKKYSIHWWLRISWSELESFWMDLIITGLSLDIWLKSSGSPRYLSLSGYVPGPGDFSIANSMILDIIWAAPCPTHPWLPQLMHIPMTHHLRSMPLAFTTFIRYSVTFFS
jgi:hypothetical protein